MTQVHEIARSAEGAQETFIDLVRVIRHRTHWIPVADATVCVPSVADQTTCLLKGGGASSPWIWARSPERQIEIIRKTVCNVEDELPGF